jgi:hypothetical protein
LPVGGKQRVRAFTGVPLLPLTSGMRIHRTAKLGNPQARRQKGGQYHSAGPARFGPHFAQRIWTDPQRDRLAEPSATPERHRLLQAVADGDQKALQPLLAVTPH